MNQLEFYEQSDCCCTTSVKQLIAFEHLVKELEQKEKVELHRYLLEEEIEQFIQNPQVLQILQMQGNAALPLTLINGQIVKSGDYPVFEELKAHCNHKAAQERKVCACQARQIEKSCCEIN